jgi:hypothetical protein
VNTTLFNIPNLTSRSVKPVRPWELPAPSLPAFAEKEEFRRWCAEENTDALFVSAFEGLNPHTRVSKSNEPYKMHGLIADYDAPVTDEQLLEGLASETVTGYRPMFAHKTFSSGVRVIWMFEEPVYVLSGVLKPFISLLVKETKAKTLFPRLDDAILKPDQYYAWFPGAIKFADQPIRTEAVHSVLSDAVEKARKYQGEGEVKIPMDRIYAKIQEVYPGRWTGAFEEGMRGPLFWIEDNIDRTGAQVTPTGMISYSTRANKGFMTWADLFGAAWVQEYIEDRFGGPLQTFWFDSKFYWKKDIEGYWRNAGKDDTRHDIVGLFGLSSSPDGRGELSEADESMRRIRESKIVHGSIPALFNPRDIVVQDGKKMLNIAKTKVIQPEEGHHEWGQEFPWLARFFDTAIEPGEALPFLMGWLKHFYMSGLQGNLMPGQAIFIAGDVGLGKTFFGTEIVAKLMGGGANASDYLVHGSQFNAELFEYAVWNVDDASSADSAEAHRHYSRMIKQGVANTRHSYHRKFMDQVTLEWRGRIIQTLNDDPESIQAVPHTDGSILDKISLFKFKAHTSFKEIKREDIPQMLARELPHFAAWLRDWEVPERVQGDMRYGVKAYHHPMLLEESKASSRVTSFIEYLDVFLQQYKADHPSEEHWKGSAIDMLLAFQNDAKLSTSMKMFVPNAQALGRMLRNISVMQGSGVRRLNFLNGILQWQIDLTRT